MYASLKCDCKINVFCTCKFLSTDYIDINDHTTVLLELNESSKNNPVENDDDVEYEYYYVYEDDPIAEEEANNGALTPTNKTERDADHFVNNHGWTPSKSYFDN